MQYLSIDASTTLQDLSNRVGDRNVQSILAVNDLERSPNIGQQWSALVNSISKDTTISVDPQRKASLLNNMTTDSDVFENAALQSNSAWRVTSQLGTFPNYLQVPNTLTLPDADDVIGNGIAVDNSIYQSAMSQLLNAPHYIDPSIFNEYSSSRNVRTLEFRTTTSTVNWFNIPWGQITLYSSISDSSLDIPAYPEEVQDSRKANYTTMPDLLYQYEPWYLYESSGPRTNTYTFNLHRDMWSGDHRDGQANQLIRFCQANCYPQFSGAAVNIPTVTLYVAGSPLISGIMEDVSVTWDGPIGLDGWYLRFDLELTITEISTIALNYESVQNISLIG